MGIKIVFLLCLLSLTMQISKFECNIEGCESCKAPNVCEVCQENYALQSVEGKSASTCIRTDCTSNCVSCNQNNECQTCAKGFLLTDSGSCISEEQTDEIKSKKRFLQFGNYSSGNQTGNYTNCTIPGCAVCNGNMCGMCQMGFQMTAIYTCISCNVAGCMYCSSPDFCSMCIQNASNLTPSPNGGACIPCNQNQTNLRGCISCNTTNSCGVCTNGLQIFVNPASEGTCILCNILNCDTCGLQALNSTIPVCTRCAMGYSISPSGDACIQCSYPCETCLPITGPNNCASCVPPMFFPGALQNGSCIKNSIPGCLAPNAGNFSLCSQCAPGFNLASDGSKCNWNCPLNCVSCISNVTCTACVVGFYVNANGTCSQCQTKGCQTCSLDGITCTACLRGFYLIGNQCKVCPGYCLDCTSNTTCNELAESNNQVLLIIGGQTVLAVCESTCITCSNLNPANCLDCADGFFLEAGKCKKCGGNCKTCDQVNRDQCLSCYSNTFLSGSQCVTCNSKCMNCLGAANPDSCTSCWDGFYLNGNDCAKGCPKNCFTCSNLTTCTQCLSGYTTFRKDSSVICAPCMTSCRTCAEGKPSTCLSCGNGFYLANTTCKPCTANCAECTSAGCLSCSQGFFMTSEQTCAMNCILPCATCSATDPASCLSCIAGYTFNDVSKTCDEVTSCPGGCIVCPMGYSLSNGLCLQCTTDRCQACNAANLGECYSCKPGAYLDDNGDCQTCSPQCRTCLSSAGCSSCAVGFTKKQNAVATAAGFECVACNAPCKTCVNTPDYCTSCVDGFDFFGWKCAQKFRFTFGVTLTVSLATFEANYMTLIEVFAAALRVTDTNAITINSITEGSVNLDGSAAPTGAPGSSQAGEQLASLTALVKSGNIAGMTVGASTIIVQDGVVGSVPEENKTNVLAIVLGICIPIGVLIIVGIIVFVVYKKKAAEKVRDFDTEEERKNGTFNNTNDKIIN